MIADRWLYVAIGACVLAIVGIVVWINSNPRHLHCVERAGTLDCWADGEAAK